MKFAEAVAQVAGVALVEVVQEVGGKVQLLTPDATGRRLIQPSRRIKQWKKPQYP